MKNFIKITLIIALVVLPVVSFAQQGYNKTGAYGPNVQPNGSQTVSNSASSGFVINCSGIANAGGIVDCIKSLMSASIYIIMSLGVVYTVYGAFNFIRAEGDDREKWRQVMVYGIVGLFVMASIWGLVAILTGTFNLSSTTQAPPPSI